MFVLLRLAEGLLAAHIFLGLSLLVGLTAFPLPARPADSPAHAMLRLVCTCAAGIALLGFAIFCLAQIGLLNAPSLLVTFALVLFIFGMVHRQTVANLAYWKRCAGEVREAWDAPAFIIYLIVLAIALPAVIPTYRGDPVSYHLAYAADWAHAGRFVIDPFLRFPFYASNFVLFFAALFVFHADSLINFLPWATALLTALGICASVRLFLREAIPSRWASVASIALTLSVVLSQVYLRWLPVAYLDVEIGAFALISALCLQLAMRENERRWLIPFAVTAGFLIGMKSAFLLLLPLFAVALWMAWRTIRSEKRYLVGMLCLLCLCSAPWYVRNLVLAGDPFPPVTNIALYGHDGIMTKADWDAIESGLATDRSVRALASLPIRAFFNPNDFKEWGATALFLLLFVPTAVVIAQRLFGGYKPSAGVLVVILSGLIVYWALTSAYLRYSLLLYPLLAVCTAACAGPLLKGRFAGPLAAAIAILTMWPSPSAEGIAAQYDLAQYNPIDSRYWEYPGDDAFLRSQDNGYAEASFTSALLRTNGIQGRVDVFIATSHDAGPEYYFRRNGIISIGDDWIGPASLIRLAAAIDTREVLPFLDDLGVVAVVIPKNSIGDLGVPLERTLEGAGFCGLSIPETQSRLLVRFSGGCKNVLPPSAPALTSTVTASATPGSFGLFYPTGVIEPADPRAANDGIYPAQAPANCCFLAASAQIRLNKPPRARRVTFSFIVPRFAPFAAAPERVIIAFNGTPVGGPVALPVGGHDVTVALPANLVALREVSATLQMSVSYLPKEAGFNGGDLRRLSIILTGVSYR